MVAAKGVVEKSEDNQNGDGDTERPQHNNCLIRFTGSVTVLLALNKVRIVEGEDKVDSQKDNYQ